MAFLDPNHPMFRRRWVRWVTVLVPAAWMVVEFATGGPFWGVIFAALAGYACWILIVQGPDKAE